MTGILLFALLFSEIYNLSRAGSIAFFSKGPDGKCSRPVGQTVSVTTARLCLCSMRSSHRQSEWQHSNETLIMDPGICIPYHFHMA